MPAAGESRKGSEALRVLVVENEPKIARALQEGLEADGYTVAVAHTGDEGLRLASAQPFDLLVLDRLLPERDGLEVLAALRQKGFRHPALILTSRALGEDRVEGLYSGADDHIEKPFALADLLIRVRALVRPGRGEHRLRLTVGDLVLGVGSRTVRRAGRLVDLTPREFDVLLYLLRHSGTIVSREMLARDVWKETGLSTVLGDVIDTHMTRLLRKVDHPPHRRLIHAVRGVGFIVKADGR